MSTRDYVSLTYEEKRELLRLNGSLLDEEQSSDNGKKVLFALYGFFVELIFDAKNHERSIRVVDSYFARDMQLQKISINLN